MWSHLSGTQLQPAAFPGVPGWGWADGRLARGGPGEKRKNGSNGGQWAGQPVRPGGTEGNPSTPGDSMTWEKLNLWAADPGVPGDLIFLVFLAFLAQSNRPNSNSKPTAPDPQSSHSPIRPFVPIAVPQSRSGRSLALTRRHPACPCRDSLGSDGCALCALLTPES